jgi:3-phenylpropionate/trans-cinnamate dioxygenase ferredoxin reductase subunit
VSVENYDYLIVGGGMTADAAVRGIRERDVNGTIAVLCAEGHPPYDRPPLSKKLWAGKEPDSIWRNTADAGAEILLNTRAVRGDTGTKTVEDARGDQYRYDKLLVATGGTPRRLPSVTDGIVYFRTFDDYQHVRELADRKSEFVVVGGGFIGSEIAAALAMIDCRVTMVFPDTGIGSRIYPPSLGNFLDAYYRERGVDVREQERIQLVERSGGRYSVYTENGDVIEADAVIAGIGIEPEVTFAQSLGLVIDNGVVVDELLCAAADIFAAGDVANYQDAALGVRRRVEHEDNANTMGAMAGRNMAGGSERYEHLPYFYSDLFDLGYEAVGELGADMEIVEDWVEPFHKGVLYYLRDGRVRGVLLWNTWDRVDAARDLIRGRESHTAADLAGRIRD